MIGRMVFQRMGGLDNAGKNERGCLKATAGSPVIELCPDAKNRRYPILGFTLKDCS